MIERAFQVLKLVLPSVAGLVLMCSCVVSTSGAPGTPPDVPLVPREDPETEVSSGLTQIRARHILIAHVDATRVAPYVTRSRGEARAVAEELRERLQEGEDFVELAKDHSDDRGSAAAGGDLGQFRREQMVPEFSNAAFSLEVGEISGVVESPFGFHVIQRTE